MNNKKKTYFITGGGTGGHIYPAISIAKALREDETTEKVYYIGNPNNLEARIAQEEGFEFLPIKITSMPRKIGLGLLKWAFKLDSATWKALFYIYKYKPNAVFGTGGYVSAPAIIGAWLSGTPYAIHDSDAHPGIVSRYVSSGAKLVSVSFEEAKKYIKNKNIEIFGNPIKAEFFTTSKEAALNALEILNNPVLLVMGGSQGAANINNATINCIKYFTQELNINVILQTGAKNFDKTIAALNEIYPEYTSDSKLIIRPYFNNMAIPLKAADLVVARAGSLSLSELAAVEVPSILVPYPHAAADHQRKNARCYEQAGASICIEDAELTPDVLKTTVTKLFNDQNKLNTMAEAVKQFKKPNAAISLKDAIKQIAK